MAHQVVLVVQISSETPSLQQLQQHMAEPVEFDKGFAPQSPVLEAEMPQERQIPEPQKQLERVSNCQRL